MPEAPVVPFEPRRFRTHVQKVIGIDPEPAMLEAAAV